MSSEMRRKVELLAERAASKPGNPVAVAKRLREYLESVLGGEWAVFAGTDFSDISMTADDCISGTVAHICVSRAKCGREDLGMTVFQCIPFRPG